MQKFKRAQAENKLSIKRHLEANSILNSSSEEEDETNEEVVQNVVDKILSAYHGQETDSERIISYLVNSFQSSSAVCLICISTVKRIDPVYNIKYIINFFCQYTITFNKSVKCIFKFAELDD